MSAAKQRVRVIAGGALVAGALLGLTATPALAWPTVITPDMQNVLDGTHGFPGDDDQRLTAAYQACRMLYTGNSHDDVVAATAANYGADPAEAANLVSLARGNLCTQAPG